MNVKYHLSNLENRDKYNELTRDILNRKFHLKLDYRADSEGRNFLWDRNRDGNVKVLVQVTRGNEINANDYTILLKNIESLITSILPARFILINYYDMDLPQIAQLQKQYPNIKFGYYNLKWIEKQLLEYTDIAEMHNVSLHGGDDVADPDEEDASENMKMENMGEVRVNISIVDNLLKSGIKFFAAGHYWGPENQIERFLSEGIWENGHDKKFVNVVKRARVGDILFLKATVRKGAIGSLRIRAVGVVTKPSETGEFLRVIWQTIPQVDLDGRGGTRGTFNQILSSNLNNILVDLHGVYPEMFAIIERLQNQANSYKSEFEKILEKYKQSYWWLNVPNDFEGDFFKNGTEQLYALEGYDRTQLNKLKRIGKGDLCVLYKKDKLYAIAKVLEAATTDIPDNILLEPNYIFTEKEQIPLAYFMHVEGFRNSQVVRGDNSETVYELLEKEYEAVLSTTSAEYDEAEAETGDSQPQPKYQTNDDKIPFHLDQVVDEDKLGRQPVAKAFVDLIKNDVFKPHLNHAFMVHLQGEWGAGKSSFLNFIKDNLNSDKETWIVVDYNAWQNQHIKPPWWTLIDHIFRKAKAELKLLPKLKLCIKENFRRVIWYRGWQIIITIGLTVAFLVFLYLFGNDIYEFLIGKSFDSSTSEKINALSDFGKLLLTITTGVGVIFSFSNFLTSSLFLKNPQEADSFMKRASDPMNRIKKHFGRLVDDINFPNKRQLAIFIDDIDRCNKEFIVELLEGIQTLFKEKRVLYIVAGDKNWITTSFGHNYKEFSNDEIKGEHLGELFLEKAFQLSFRMPSVESKAKEKYWNFILGLKENQEEKTKEIESINLLGESERIHLEQVVSRAENIASQEFVNKLEQDFKLSADAVSNFVIEEKNKKKEELRHLLKGFHELIDPNPRSIKRLANNYTMTRSTLIAERTFIKPEKIFRWLLVEDIYPRIKRDLKSCNTIDTLKAYFETNIPDKIKQEKCIRLILDEQNEIGGVLEMEEIVKIIGF